MDCYFRAPIRSLIITLKKIVAGQVIELKTNSSIILISYPVSTFWEIEYLPYQFEIKLETPVTQEQAIEFNSSKTHQKILFFEMTIIEKEGFRGSGQLIDYGGYPLGSFSHFSERHINQNNFTQW